MNFKHLLCAAAIAGLPGFATATTDTPMVVTETTSAGIGNPISVRQPSLELTPLIRVGSNVLETLGEVKWFGGNFAPQGYALANGQELPISGNESLFSRLGTIYGGNGLTTFKLPDLSGRAVLGAGGSAQLGRLYGQSEVTLTENNLPAHSHVTGDGFTTTSFGTAPANVQAVDVRMPSVALNYRINQFGVFPSFSEAIDRGSWLDISTEASIGDTAQLATVFMDAGAGFSSTNNSTPATGALLPIISNQAMYSLLGTTYGGDGRTTFRLPDTSDRLVMGQGTAPGLSQRPLGSVTGQDQQTVSGTPFHTHSDAEGTTSAAGVAGAMLNVMEETLAMNYIVSLQGIFPSPPFGSSNISSPANEPFIGEIALFAGNFAPRGWALAQGQLLQISQYSALFSIFGTRFGGNGQSTFALPDLRGRVPVGTISSFVSSRSGVENVFLTSAELPSHTHEAARPIPLPAGAVLILSALGGLSLLRRRRVAG